jgi:hypothetical protein
LGSL